MKASIAVLLLCIGIVLCAPGPPPQATLYPVTADGFDTVILDDMSFTNELSFQSFGPNGTNITFYVYGQSRIRTVFPGHPAKPEFSVGTTPNINWHLPFIDFHTFQNGSDVWGLGPINALYARNRTAYSGFQFEIAVFSTKYSPDNPRGRYFVEQPLGFEGTFYSVRIVAFDPQNVIGYFAGYFPSANTTTPNALNFGVRRAHFNVSLFEGAYDGLTPAWSFNSSVDDVPLFPNAQLVTFNTDYKPILLHAWNVSQSAPINSTWLVIIDPYMNVATLIMGNFNPLVPLVNTGHTYVPIFGNQQFGNIVSAVIWENLLFVGISVEGVGTGWIDVLYLDNLTRRADSIMLPANYSDPRALVLDFFDPAGTIYIGMNGGSSVLRLSIPKLAITGFQNLPFYLHRTWRGQPTHEHIYFITNEQHSKVYRMAKADFCPTACMQFGYCKNGQCVCGPNLVKQGNSCEWKTVVIERHLVSVEKGGEIALGILFGIALVAALAGWYMVWKNRRGYQAVA